MSTDRMTQLRRSLTNIRPDEEQIQRIEEVRQVGIELGETIAEIVPPGREQSLAFTHLEETVMWAVKAIVLEDD